MTKGKTYVAKILTSQGHDIKMYPQLWAERSCNSYNRFITTDNAEALRLVNNNLISLLNAFKTDSAINIVDGIILWECDDL